MKERLSNIEPEVYDAEIYPQLVCGTLVGQKTLEDDVVFYPNPESKFYPTQKEPLEEYKRKDRHSLQGEFILVRQYNNKMVKMV